VTAADYASLLDAIGVARASRRGTFEAILRLLESAPRGRALDAPCGPGLLAAALQRVGHRVVAADLAPEVSPLVGRLPLARADLDAPLPFADACFDLAVCADGIEHLENSFQLFRELGRVLRPEGQLVVATPNYGSLERRLRFLLSGSLTRPLARAGDGPPAPKALRGHIHPLTPYRLAWMAEEAGLRLVAVETAQPRRGQRWLAPLLLPILLYRAGLRAERRAALFADWTLSRRVLLGGHTLIALFERRPTARSAASAKSSGAVATPGK
jgi:SAM-dependent methyltransferase